MERTISKHDEKGYDSKRPVKLDGKYDEGYRNIDESRDNIEQHKLVEVG